MIPEEEEFKFAEEKQPIPQTEGLVDSLEAMGFRPFTEEW